MNVFVYGVCFRFIYSTVESFLNRKVDMDCTTISFDFEANPPPHVSIEQSRTSSMHVSSASSQLPSFDSINDDSTSSLVFIAHDPMDDLLGEPFIGTPEPSFSDDLLGEPFIGIPEPSFSPPLFEAVSISDTLLVDNLISYDPMSSNDNISYESSSPNHMSYDPSMPNYDNNRMSYETSSPLSLLPFLVSPPEHDENSQFFVPTFELAFMDNNAYEQFLDEYQPQLEVEMLSVYERSDRTLIYEQL